ncbi:UDP-glucose 4-epimerase [Rhodococcus sp. NPDC059234]|uniref:UDP-glucose 4-epimerase n=1 Tax=Rhodococcus sp. NPDC059234 TaxID=3346781 RepID=UPI00366E265B
MGEQLRVDTDALRSLAASLRGEADRIAGLDPAGPIDAALRAMPGSSVGSAAARAGAELTEAYRDTAERLRDMAAAAESNHRAYDAAEQSFRQQLDTRAAEI